MFKKNIIASICCLILIHSVASASLYNKTITNQTFSGRVKSALLSSYELLQEKAAKATSWLSGRYAALRGKKAQPTEHPEELLPAPENKKPEATK